MRTKDKIALITGSTDGVGRQVAIDIAELGATIIVHGRDAGRGRAVVREIENAGGKAVFYAADFSRLSGVRQLAEAVRRDQGHLDALVNNAGIGTGRLYNMREVSGDGHELRFAVNYLSGFLLTYLLLPLLQATDGARIVNVASAGQQAIDLSDVMLTRGYSGTRAYCQSKLAQIMFTMDLARQLDAAGIAVNCLHPASYMNTTMVRADGIAPASSVEEGARAIFNLLLPATEHMRTGLYFDGLRPSRALAQAYDAEARAHLRRISLDLTGLPEQAGYVSKQA